jgi:hypothetical protein
MDDGVHLLISSFKVNPYRQLVEWERCHACRVVMWEASWLG